MFGLVKYFKEASRRGVNRYNERQFLEGPWDREVGEAKVPSVWFEQILSEEDFDALIKFELAGLANDMYWDWLTRFKVRQSELKSRGQLPNPN